MDEEMRDLERRSASGDSVAGARLNRMKSRVGGMTAFVLSLVGKLVFIEGLRINYRGVLKDVLVDGDGRIEGLLFDRLQRVSWFKENGPEINYTFTHCKLRAVPWDTVLDIGEEDIAKATDQSWSAP